MNYVYAGLAAIAILAAYTYVVYEKGRHDQYAESAIVQRDSLIAYANKVSKGIEEHDKNIAITYRLRNELNSMRYQRLPTCEQANNSDGGTGVFYEKANAAFERLQQGDNIDFERCDRLNIDAIRVNKINN